MKEKTVLERIQEVRTLYEQLFSFGFPEDLDSIKVFRAFANRFVKTGEGASGSIPMVGYKRNLVYTLSNQPHITSMVILKHAPHV